MTKSEIDKLTKLRLHMRSNPEVAKKVSEAIGNVAKDLGVELDKSTYENLIVIHRSELDTEISVTLPVGAQCGF